MDTNDSIQQRDNEIQNLKERIEQLNEELKTATAEKIQSAQYGLVLLVWQHHQKKNTCVCIDDDNFLFFSISFPLG